MQVSVTVITRNESSGLRRMLESVRWADEVIVVDCGSTDDTVTIAKECGARVDHHEFQDFASQKNHAQSLAAREWILNLDADEICPPQLAQEIQSLSENGHAGYSIPRRNYFQNRWIKHCGWYPDYKLRLYRKSVGSWKGKVHESVQLPAQAKTDRLKTPMEHYTYKGLERYLESVHQFSTLAAQQMKEQGRKFRAIDLIVRPPVAFLKKYFLQLGFLDGRPGFVISILTAYGLFLRYSFLFEKSEKKQ